VAVFGYFDVQPLDASTLANDLASLGYPGFAHIKSKRKKNPEEVLISAFSSDCLESRVAEALPWLLLRYSDLDWPTLINTANAKGLQNKLGFVTCLARKAQRSVEKLIKRSFFISTRKF
jgi:hypothetical protein